MRVKSKNIHILPTDKPSRLHEYSNIPFLGLSKEALNWKEAQHIYITSDEEIKEGVDVKDKWVISEYGFVIKADRIENNYLIHSNGGSNYLCYYKFIILTTDPDLIKDGVQAIDDEFLEWFVKNPSCEWVKVEHERVLWENGEITHYKYKIIIPKEVLNSISSKNIPSEFNDIVNKEFFNLIEEPKQETLEEAAKFLNEKFDGNGVSVEIIDWSKNERYAYPPTELLKQYSKWQQEQDKNKFSELAKFRNELYEQLPTGKVNAFDLIKIINNHINRIDELI